MTPRDLRSYGWAVEAFRAVLVLRVGLCPPESRERLREALLVEVKAAVDEVTLAGFEDGEPTQ